MFKSLPSQLYNSHHHFALVLVELRVITMGNRNGSISMLALSLYRQVNFQNAQQLIVPPANTVDVVVVVVVMGGGGI